MPLLEKKKFVRLKPPANLRPDEMLYYCSHTHEVFREYDQFFERVILCNSLAWSCSLTGRSNMTFMEAKESEEAARESLRSFPKALKKPVLYLASLNRKSRLNEMCDDVFAYVKDRFFVGEEVEVLLNGIKKSCEITQVIAPEKQQKSAQKSPVKDGRNRKPPPQISPSKMKYEVVNYTTGKTVVVKPECISRSRGTYTKPKNKLFIKINSEPKNGIWTIKEKSGEKLELDEFNFSEVFCGSLPSYAIPVTPKKATTPNKNEKSASKRGPAAGKKTIQGKLNFKKESAEERKKSVEKQHALFEKQRAAEKQRQKLKEDLKRQIEEDKERQRQEKLKEKKKQQEEKKKLAEYLNSWKKSRDDLECDDLKDLPPPNPVDCGIPQDCFGDAILILEFLNTFKKQIQLSHAFPHGFNFEHLEKALVETEIQGYFNDLLQLLLTTLLQNQEDEKMYLSGEIKIDVLDNKDLTADTAMSLGATVSTWPQKYHGTALRNMPLDPFSVTEILRLHILSSAGRRRTYWQSVSGISEDPSLEFTLAERDLIKTLATKNVFQLDCVDRVKILNLLVHQLLSCDTVKSFIDENADKTRPLRHQLKQLRWAYSRKVKEDKNNSNKKNQAKEVNGESQPEGTSEDPATVEDEEKENTAKMTPEERAEFEEKKAKEAAKQKSEFLRKEKEIESQIRKLQSTFNVAPIGRDRAYRRYWIFQSVSGIFVEDEDPFKGGCLPKRTLQMQSPNSINRCGTSPSNVKKYIHQINDTKNGSSDKENDIMMDLAIVQNELPSPLKYRKLSDLNRNDFKKYLNSAPEIQTCIQCKSKLGDIHDTSKFYCPHSKLNFPQDQCTANIHTCPVHNFSAPRTKWSFYYREEEVDDLIASLNPRGFREMSLREALVNEKERIKEMIAKCPCHVINKLLPMPVQLEVRKSQRRQSSRPSVFTDMSSHQALEVTLREAVLELDNRIFAGGLGSIKVVNREQWTTAIEQGGYDKQCDKLMWRTEEIIIKSEKGTDDAMVKDLAGALLQVSQGIEAKYLSPPLGETDNYKKLKQKALDEIVAWESTPNRRESWKYPQIPVSPLERWQESLLKCTSMSQLFVHLGTLERSVAWSRSVLRAHCKICRRRGDGENMLLCDGCNRGHHLYCLKPPLESIPEGDWFCLSCRPIEKTISPRRKEKAESDSDESYTSENESDESSEEEAEREENEGEEKVYYEEMCEACGDVGTLLCCDKCPLLFHPECVNLKRIPRGEWLCPKCSKKDEAIKKAQKHPPSGSYGTRSQTLTSGSNKQRSSRGKGSKRKYEGSFEDDYEPPKKIPKGNKRKYEVSFEDDYEPPKFVSKAVEESPKQENPFKKVYKDSEQNASRRRSRTNNSGDMLDYKACLDLLVELMRHPSSWPFLVPVSKKDAPDYHLVIKRPMDFGTIRSKLNYMQYKNNEDFVRDIYLVLQNCEWFNPRTSQEFKAAQILYKEVKRLLKDYQLYNPFENSKNHNVNES